MSEEVRAWRIHTRSGTELEVRFRGSVDNDADAKKVSDGYKGLIKQGLDSLPQVMNCSF